jgi:hypothetical protein
METDQNGPFSENQFQMMGQSPETLLQDKFENGESPENKWARMPTGKSIMRIMGLEGKGRFRIFRRQAINRIRIPDGNYR